MSQNQDIGYDIKKNELEKIAKKFVENMIDLCTWEANDEQDEEVFFPCLINNSTEEDFRRWLDGEKIVLPKGELYENLISVVKRNVVEMLVKYFDDYGDNESLFESYRNFKKFFVNVEGFEIDEKVKKHLLNCSEQYIKIDTINNDVTPYTVDREKIRECFRQIITDKQTLALVIAQETFINVFERLYNNDYKEDCFDTIIGYSSLLKEYYTKFLKYLVEESTEEKLRQILRIYDSNTDLNDIRQYYNYAISDFKIYVKGYFIKEFVDAISRLT